MKNQYFGDKRDYLKFSLLEHLSLGLSPEAPTLSIIWMLTSPDGRSDGSHKFVLEEQRAVLGRLLINSVESDQRDVRLIAPYFTSRGIGYRAYGDSDSPHFSKENRERYFAGVPAQVLRSSVVFVDPDNGLEPGKATAAHLRFAELRGILEGLEPNGVTVVYQHLPRIRGDSFWPALTKRIADEMKSSAFYVASGDVGFLAATRSDSTANSVAALLQAFVASWRSPLRWGASGHLGVGG